jgi:hypothetical protein
MNTVLLLFIDTVAIQPEYVPVFTKNKSPIECVVIGVSYLNTSVC